jgi:hypothetical protein
MHILLLLTTALQPFFLDLSLPPPLYSSNELLLTTRPITITNTIIQGSPSLRPHYYIYYIYYSLPSFFRRLLIFRYLQLPTINHAPATIGRLAPSSTVSGILILERINRLLQTVVSESGGLKKIFRHTGNATTRKKGK